MVVWVECGGVYCARNGHDVGYYVPLMVNVQNVAILGGCKNCSYQKWIPMALHELKKLCQRYPDWQELDPT